MYSARSLFLIFLAILAGGCKTRQRVIKSEPKRFSGDNACRDLEGYVEDSAVARMRASVNHPEERFQRRTAALPGELPRGDILAHDGENLSVISGRRVFILDAKNPDQVSIVGRLNLTGWPLGLLSDKPHRLIIFESAWSNYPLADGCMNESSPGCGRGDGNSAIVSVVDLTNPAAPSVLYHYVLPGNFQGAFVRGQILTVITSESPSLPVSVRTFPESEDAGTEQLIARNESEIRALSLDEWFPSATFTLDGSTLPLPNECEKFTIPQSRPLPGASAIVSIDLENPGSYSRDVLLSASTLALATQANLVLSSVEELETQLHLYDLDPRTEYRGSASIPGRLRNIDLTDGGVIRSVSQRWKPRSEERGSMLGSEATWHINALSRSNGTLSATGALSQDGELTSARLTDRAAYLALESANEAQGRLLKLDLSDLAQPKVASSIELPAPAHAVANLSEHQVLLLTGAGGGTGTSLVVYETEPELHATSSLKIPPHRGELDDGVAMTFFPSNSLIAVPYTEWTDNQPDVVSELRTYKDTPDGGLKPLGTMSLSKYAFSGSGAVDGVLASRELLYPRVRRTLVRGDDLFIASEVGVQVAKVADPSHPLSTVAFPSQQP